MEIVDKNTGGYICGVDTLPLQNSASLRLPSFKIGPLGLAPGFDAWLQRGRLAAKYREAQQFMSVAITLRQQLPQESVTRTFADHGMVQQGARNVVRYPYVGEIFADEDDGDERIPNWKARYSVWTQFGDWISEECFQRHSATMHSNSAPRRKHRLEELRQNEQNLRWKNKTRVVFTNTLAKIWNDLIKIDEDPRNYINSKDDSIDTNHYECRFDKKLADDLLLSHDVIFCDRYISGYDFPRVPKFRQDAPASDAFVDSWCQSVVIEARKSASQSLILKALKNTLRKSGKIKALSDAGEINKILINN